MAGTTIGRETIITGAAVTAEAGRRSDGTASPQPVIPPALSAEVVGAAAALSPPLPPPRVAWVPSPVPSSRSVVVACHRRRVSAKHCGPRPHTSRRTLCAASR